MAELCIGGQVLCHPTSPLVFVCGCVAYSCTHMPVRASSTFCPSVVEMPIEVSLHAVRDKNSILARMTNVFTDVAA
eukprot:8085466-Karenia_brevis.AAC.1